MAEASETTLAYIAEATAGTTPATPAFKFLRLTNESLNAEFDTLTSNELRPDATVADVRRTGLSVSGDLAFELHRDSGFEDILAASIRGTWATNTLKGGVAKPSFTFERKVIGLSATTYFRFAGCRISGLSLSFAPDDIITGSLKVMGTAHPLPTTAILTGATYGNASTSAPMSGVDVTSLAVSGVTGVDYSALTIEVDNNMRIQRRLGSVAARGVGYGRRQVTGTLTAYFEDINAYTAFINNTTPSIIATASDGTNSYTITLPRVRFTGGDVPNPGNDQDIMLTLNWQAIYDSTLLTDIQIVRA